MNVVPMSDEEMKALIALIRLQQPGESLELTVMRLKLDSDELKALRDHLRQIRAPTKKDEPEITIDDYYDD